MLEFRITSTISTKIQYFSDPQLQKDRTTTTTMDFTEGDRQSL